MEKLTLSIALVKKTLLTLESGFKVLKEAHAIQNSGFILAAQDSIIQRFEYCYDSFWKLLKNYLETKYSLEDIASPKKVFRAFIKLELAPEKTGEILINMADDRNETSHNYNIEKVRIILEDIPLYYKTMLEIVNKLEKN